ncbi:MAG: MscL family protein [Candidatus Nanoarchaeia archaeon]|jgi:large conductance mechanosensitive channel
MGLIKEFKEFLYEYKIMGLAIAFMMGAAINSLITSLVNDIIMPLITSFVPEGAWKDTTLIIGPVVLKWGSFLSNLINFVIIALVIFFIAKIFFKEKKEAKK